MTSSLGKFQVREGPLQTPPHNCAGCGRYQKSNGEELKFIDWGLDLDFLGGVFICEDCVVEMANQFGMVSKEQADKLILENRFIKSQLEGLREKNGVLQDAVGSLGSFNSSITAPLLSTVGAREESESLPESIPESTGREEGSVQQTDEQGSSDLSDDDGLDELLKDI